MRFFPALFTAVWLGFIVHGAENTPSNASTPRATREQEASLKWYQARLTEAYHKVGKRDAKWDSPVESALFLVAEGLAEVPASDPKWREMAVELADSAIRDGCTDPLVRFTARRYRGQSKRSARKSADVAAEWVALAGDMSASGYAPNWKFHAELEAAAALRSAMPQGTNTWPEIHQHRHAAMAHLVAALGDKTTPRAELTEMVTAERNLVRSNPKQLAAAWAEIEPLLRKNWPKLALADLIDGRMAITAAWKARGSGTIDTVTEEGYRKFSEELEKARRLLTRAWENDKTDPSAPTEMLTVCMGLEKGADEVETWFARAMEARPGHMPAIRAKIQNLAPKWGGSLQALYRFGRQCLKEESWGDEAPWGLVLVHDEMAAALADGAPGEEWRASKRAYWRRPGVWKEVEEVVAVMKQRNPSAEADLDYRLVMHATRCAMWSEVVKVAPKLSPEYRKRVSGTNSFDAVLAEVKALAAKEAKP
jgi:hypothetical protein